MKFTLLAAAFVFTAVLSAAEIKVDLSKAKVGDTKAPGWSLNGLNVKEPGKISIVEGSKAGTLAIQVVTGEYATPYFRTNSIPAKAGDTLKVTAKIKGEGKATFGVYGYAVKGFVPTLTPGKAFDLTADFQEVVYEVELVETKVKDKEGNIKAVASIRPVFTTAANSKLIIEDMKFEVIAK
jgi:hypothetical protein